MPERTHATQTVSAPDHVAIRPDATPPRRRAGTWLAAPDRRATSGLRAGGVAALVAAATFVFGFVIYGTVVAAGDYANPAVDPVTHMEFLADHEVILQVWYTIIYLVFGGALVVLATVAGDHLRHRTPVLARTATAFGLIWATLMFAVGMSAIVGGDMVLAMRASDPAQAASLWTTVNLVVEGMGGGIELVGGAWIGVVSIAALRAGAFPAWLSRVGVVAGVAGVASTALVATEVVTSVFGLGSIVWFTWLGVHMVRRPRTQAVDAR